MATNNARCEDKHTERNNNFLLADVWDREYLLGKYDGEGPLVFAKLVATRLKRVRDIQSKRGLYIGCGTGRNYIMLAKLGLNVVGLDVSGVGLAKIKKHSPDLAHKLVQKDFLDYDDSPFHYIISIQSFQHGNLRRVEMYLKKAAMMLGSGGLFFLRVNASNTDVMLKHEVAERTDGGFTVLYKEGPKKGLSIRFFSKEEIMSIMDRYGLYMERDPQNVVIKRPGQPGAWAQWEIVAKKR